MIGVLTSIIGLCAGLAPGEMAEVVAARLRALDKLEIHLTVESYAGLSGTPVLDRGAWGTPYESYPYRLTILRPNVRAEFLKDDEARGYEPVVAALVNDTYTARHVRPLRADGKTLYTVANGTGDGGVLPREALQVFGLGVFHYAPPWALDIVGVLQHPSAVLVRSSGGVSTYAASLRVEKYAYTVHFELDIDDAGNPLRVKTVADFDHADTPDACAEQFLVRSEGIDGVEVPMETVVTLWGLPDHWSVSVVRVDQVRFLPDLSLDDIRIEIERHDAHVSEYSADGRRHSTTYDAAGQVIQERFFDPADSPGVQQASSWRMAVPPVAMVVALGTAGLLTHASRQVRR